MTTLSSKETWHFFENYYCNLSKYYYSDVHLRQILWTIQESMFALKWEANKGLHKKFELTSNLCLNF